MEFYKVTKKEISYSYIFVQANSKDHAKEIAEEVDIDGWRDGKYECNTAEPVNATPEEMKGCFVEKEDGTAFIYSEKEKA